MSAIGTKRTSVFAPHMSAIGGKADMTFCGNSLAVAIGGKADMPSGDGEKGESVRLNEAQLKQKLAVLR